MATTRMPSLYLSHGAPPLAEDPIWPAQLASWSQRLPKPAAILVVSAHWEEAPVTLAATRTVPLVYDFWGFPQRFFEVSYPAPGAPALAQRVRGLLTAGGTAVHDAPDRGLDHGAYVPLVEMYPDATVPVLQLSMPSLEPTELHDLGRRLAPLRDEGVLIMGSGFFTHNLREVNMRLPSDHQAPAWSAEFDEWGDEALRAGDLDTLLDFRQKAPAAGIAHPRIEHFAPLFVALGAGDEGTPPSTAIDGYWYGLAKRSIQIG